MSSSPLQKAFILPRPGSQYQLTTRSVPHPGPGEVLVEVRAAALNAFEAIVQRQGGFFSDWPAILGNNGAGIVCGLGDGVTNLQKEYRIFFQAMESHELGTLQQYTVATASRAARIPNNLSFDEAATVPANLATAAIGMYRGQLDPPGVRGRYQGAGYTAPWAEGGMGKYKDQPVLIIGGSNSVGKFAIQLAKLSGFNPIVTTASAHNAEYCRHAGTTHVLDYHTTPYAALPAAIAQITSKPVQLVYDAISVGDSQRAALQVVARGGHVVITLPSEIDAVDQREDGTAVVFVFGWVSVPVNRQFGDRMYTALTNLLATGGIKPNRLDVLPNGHAGAPAGVDRLANHWVSGVKLVIHPQQTA